MHLTLEPEVVTWAPTHYVFVEKTGPFIETAPQAWQQVRRLESLISGHNLITGAMSLYRMSPATYRAGFIVAAPPAELPDELSYQLIGGGSYSRFVLTGAYSNLPQASGRVWEYVSKNNLMVRPEFAIEHYANDPKSTPEDQLITEILIPTA